jgi:predicted kinase
MMKQLILIRGLPGSGKSTMGELIARSYRLSQPAFHIEADMFFMNADGKYEFVAANLYKAHKWCQETCDTLLQSDYDAVVVVTNTFTQIWEMKPYFLFAEIHGAAMQIIECKGRFGSIHNVPAEAVERMINRWEDIPMIGFWGKMKGEARDEAAKLSRSQEQASDSSVQPGEAANESYAG